jgi:hypothetical protein
MSDITVCEGVNNIYGQHKFSISSCKRYKNEFRVRKECFYCNVEAFTVVRAKKEKSEITSCYVDELQEFFINENS